MWLTSLRRSSIGDMAVLITTLHLVSIVKAITFQQAPTPNLDLSQLGRVALAGSYDSVSLYNYVGQGENTLSANGSQSLLGQYPNAAGFASLGNSDASIQALCPFMPNGQLSGVIVGGNFTSFGGQEVQAVALYDPNSQAITPLSGLTGQVKAVYCDNERSTVYVGGSFTGGNSSNAIAWTTGWSNLPFSGFNGPVSAISKLDNGHIIFGGQFSGIGHLKQPTRLDAQVVNIGSANISSGPNSDNPGYRDPKNILCKTSSDTGVGNNWLAANGAGAYFRADFGFGFEPSKLRLYQSQVPNTGVKTWRFTAFPINGIMNFTYVDSTGQEQSCTNFCTLPANNATYQDFRFVNTVGMDSFQIDITDWYGEGAGLGGIELFQNDIYSFAVSAFNEPKCDDVSTGSTSQSTGNWTQMPAGQSNAMYLSTYLPNGTNTTDMSGTAVVFQPDIQQSGNYSITVYTPGCLNDKSCDTRGIVNITGTVGTSTDTAAQPISTTLFQTNNYDKYDQVYLGYVDANRDSFRPTVTLTPASGQTKPVTVVAQRVRFELTGTSGGLNGLYEYDPNSSNSGDEDFSQNPIDSAGMRLDEDAAVNSLLIVNDVTYVAGYFKSSKEGIANIFAIQNGNMTALANGGLNAAVQSLYSANNLIYAGGNFTNTQDNSSADLNNVAAYHIQSRTWQPLGAGVNGQVSDITPVNIMVSGQSTDVLAVSGMFDSVNAFGQNASSPVTNVAIWVPSKNNWLMNIPGGQPAVSGKFSAYTDVPNGGRLWAGSVNFMNLAASDASGLTSSSSLGLEKLPINIRPSGASSSSMKKRTSPQGPVNGVWTGLFYNQNDIQATILGGHFDATASNGSTISNLALAFGKNGDTVTGLATDTGSDVAVLTLDTVDTTLYYGGTIPTGFRAYDLNTRSESGSQPPALSGTPLSINAIATRPKSKDVYVGGSFELAGSLPCEALCVWHSDAMQWQTPMGSVGSSGLSAASSVNELMWASNDRLIIAGNLTIDGNYSTLASYDAKVGQYTLFAGSGDINNVPGPISTFTAIDGSYGSFFVTGVSSSNGSSFFTKYTPRDTKYPMNAGTWTSALNSPNQLGTQSRIEGIQALPLSNSHPSTPLLDDDQTILITGQLHLSQGNASAALWNGAGFEPFSLSIMQDGSPGAMRRIFVANPQNLLNTKHSSKLALGFIVLIALAIALGLIFLIVVIGIVAERIRRRREGYIPAPSYNYAMEKGGRPGNVGTISPDRLFGSLGQSSPAAPRI